MLNQFCYQQLSGGTDGGSIDDEACIATLSNISTARSSARRPECPTL
jgi:hypothetical protein